MKKCINRREVLKAAVGITTATVIGVSHVQASGPDSHWHWTWKLNSLGYGDFLDLFLNDHLVGWLSDYPKYDAKTLEAAKHALIQREYWQMELHRLNHGDYPNWFYGDTTDYVPPIRNLGYTYISLL